MFTRGRTIERIIGNGNANFGVTFPELYLTKAEVLARSQDVEGAMAIVNMIRVNRIPNMPPDDPYTDLVTTSSEDALRKVLDERRIELAFGGQRWMDMKRLDAEGRMPEVLRYNVDTRAKDGSLPPKSPNYVFEIPGRVLLFNPEMTKNH